MMSSDTGLIHFDDVRVPQRNRIGEEGMGFTYQMLQFQEERLWAAANAIQGAARTASRMTADYTRERKMFGQTSSTTRSCTSGSPSSRPRSRRCAA